MIVHTETGPAEPDVVNDSDEEDRPLLTVRVEVGSELGYSWGSVETIPQEVAVTDPDQVAGAMIRCLLAVGQLRGSDTLIALQQRLANWGRSSG